MSPVSKIPENEWLTKQEAAQCLNVAERTVDRLSLRGHFQKRTQRRPGLPTIAVYHAGDLKRYAALQAERHMAAARATAFPVPDIPQALAPLSDTLVSLLGAVTGVLASGPLYIPLTEAAARLGLNERYVRQCVREGKLRAVRLVVDGRRVTKVRAADLDAV